MIKKTSKALVSIIIIIFEYSNIQVQKSFYGNMLIWCSRKNYYYQCWKQVCCL